MNPWPITPLGTKDLDFAVKNYDFTTLTANGLAGTPELLSAIDATLADFGQSVTDQTALIASMAGDLDDLYAILNELAADNIEQVLADLGKIAAAGDALGSYFDSLI